MHYIAFVHREGKYWLADFPDAPGCQTFAESSEELQAMAQEALELWLEGHLVDGKAPPRPRLRRRAPTKRTLRKVYVSPSLSTALQIRWARQDLGLTQKQLAQRLGLKQQQIAKLENPDENPTLKSLDEVAKGLGLSVDLLFAKAG